MALRGALRRPLLMAAFAERIEQQTARADGNRSVGDVEGGEVPAAPVKIDEVDDEAVDHAVEHVAQCAAEHERQTDRKDRLIRADPPQPDHQREADRERKQDEEPALPARRLRKNAEGGAGVFEIHDVEYRQQLDRVLHLHGADDQRLGRLINHDDEERQP